MKIVIATIKTWNVERAQALRERYQGIHEIKLMTKKEELTAQALEEFAPDFVFLPHWSYWISDEITQKWNCVVFHMTDLPFGRGGSPLQNLIVRGYKETKLSAIKVTKIMDGGPVYMKCPLDLSGSAREILTRASDIIFSEMIPKFLEEMPTPKPQGGEAVIFKRRKPADGEIKADMTMEQIYDYIRMLDAEGYPNAFIPMGEYELQFSDAHFDENNSRIEARVVFAKKEEMECEKQDADDICSSGTS